jgi:AraC family transcriptional regulator
MVVAPRALSEAASTVPQAPWIASWQGLELRYGRLAASESVEHTHPTHQIVLALEECVAVDWSVRGLEQTGLRLTHGEVTVIPAGFEHWIRWQGGGAVLALALCDDLVRRVGTTLGMAGPQIEAYAGREPLLCGALLALGSELERAAEGYETHAPYLETLSGALVAHLLRRHAAPHPTSAQPSARILPSALERVRIFVEENIEAPLSLADLAAQAGLSPYHFARAFRRRTGLPPHRYVTSRRIARAKQMLESTDLPIAEIAYTVGLASQSHLTTLFRRFVGTTPRAYRDAWAARWSGPANPRLGSPL